MKRTYILFENKAQREKALDFLVKTNIKYTYNYLQHDNPWPCWISFAPKTFVKECIDIYLNGLFYNSFSKF